MITQVPLNILETTLNHALNLDATMFDRLAVFTGKTLRVFVVPFQFTFYMQFSSQGLHLLSAYDGTVDASIESNPMGLIRLSLLPASQARSLFHEGVSIEGDVEFAQHVKAVMDALDIDWEGHLARFTGDMVAHGIGSCVRKMKTLFKQSVSSANLQLSSYLQEEIKWIPAPLVVQDFCDEVDELVLEVERLTAKVNAIPKKSRT